MYEPGEHAPAVRRSGGPRMNMVAFVKMIEGMNTPLGRTIPQLVDFTGLGQETLRAYCKALVLAEQAHICGWEKDGLGRDTTPRYRLGWGVNIPRSLKKTNNHRSGNRDARARVRKQARIINESTT